MLATVYITVYFVCLQNNVLELWSLFDFLMPGFLGTEKQFYERYGKPIIQSRDAKSSSKEQEAGLAIIIQSCIILFVSMDVKRFEHSNTTMHTVYFHYVA